MTEIFNNEILGISSENYAYLCDKCRKCFITSGNFCLYCKNHICDINLPETYEVKCNKCNFIMPKSSLIKPNFEFLCPICKKIINSRDFLKHNFLHPKHNLNFLLMLKFFKSSLHYSNGKSKKLCVKTKKIMKIAYRAPILTLINRVFRFKTKLNFDSNSISILRLISQFKIEVIEVLFNLKNISKLNEETIFHFVNFLQSQCKIKKIFLPILIVEELIKFEKSNIEKYNIFEICKSKSIIIHTKVEMQENLSAFFEKLNNYFNPCIHLSFKADLILFNLVNTKLNIYLNTSLKINHDIDNNFPLPTMVNGLKMFSNLSELTMNIQDSVEINEDAIKFLSNIEALKYFKIGFSYEIEKLKMLLNMFKDGKQFTSLIVNLNCPKRKLIDCKCLEKLKRKSGIFYLDSNTSLINSLDKSKSELILETVCGEKKLIGLGIDIGIFYFSQLNITMFPLKIFSNFFEILKEKKLLKYFILFGTLNIKEEINLIMQEATSLNTIEHLCLFHLCIHNDSLINYTNSLIIEINSPFTFCPILSYSYESREYVYHYFISSSETYQNIAISFARSPKIIHNFFKLFPFNNIPLTIINSWKIDKKMKFKIYKFLRKKVKIYQHDHLLQNYMVLYKIIFGIPPNRPKARRSRRSEIDNGRHSLFFQRFPSLFIPLKKINLNLIKESIKFNILFPNYVGTCFYKSNINDRICFDISQLFLYRKSCISLMLSNNNISNIGCMILSNAISKGKNCLYLSLDDNQIEYEGLKEIYKNLQKKDILEFSGFLTNKLNTIKGRNLIVIAKHFNFIKEDPIFNSQQIDDIQILELASYIKKYSFQIQELNISKNLITDLGISVLIESLFKLTTLKKFCLNENLIGDEGVKYIGKLAKCCAGLNLIELNENKITNRGCKILCSLISAKSIHISLLENQIGKEGFKSAFEICKLNSGIKLFGFLSISNIIDDGLDNIPELAKLNLIPNEFNLSNKIVSDNVWNHLEISLLNDKYFKKLNYSKTEIGYSQMIKIQNFVVTMKGISHLIFDRNNINDKACEFIGQILKKTQIKYLSLSYNLITNQGISLLSPLIIKAEKLESLILSNNKIGEPGFSQLFKYGNQSKSLELIDLTNNPVKQKNIKETIFKEKRKNLDLKISS